MIGTYELDGPRTQRLAYWLLAVGVVSALLSVPVLYADPYLSHDIRDRILAGDLRKAIELSEAFAHGTGVAAILICILLATWPPKVGVWTAIATTAASGVTANLLKAAFTRTRPYVHDGTPRSGDSTIAGDVTGWEFLGSGSFWDASQRSFPSGHTATAWGLAIGLSLLYPRAGVIFILLALLASYQRLYSGAHFPSDVVAGFAVACICSGLVIIIGRRWPGRGSPRGTTEPVPIDR